MLFLIKLIRKVFKQIKSDLTPAQIAIGVFLGVLMGLTPSGLHWILLFMLALLINCSMGAYLLCWGAFKLFFLVIADSAFGLGFNLLAGGYGFWTGIAQFLSEAPLLAWLGYDRYIVFGAYVIAIPTALVIGLLTYFAIPAYREKVSKRIGEKSWYQKMMKVGVLRFVVNFFFGKDVETGEKKKRILVLRPFRAYMVVAVPLLIIGLTVGGGLWAQWFIDGLAADAASQALGVKCTFGKVGYAFFGQELKFDDFQLPDPDKPSTDMIRIGAFEADLGFTSLLSKRFHVESLLVKDVSFSVARDKDGKLNIEKVAEPDPQDPQDDQTAWKEFLEYVKKKDIDWAELWKKYMEYRKKKAEEPEVVEAPPAPKYDAALRWNPARRIPLVRVDSIKIENLRFSLEDGGDEKSTLPALTSVTATGAQLSTIPGWNGEALTLTGKGDFNDGKAGSIGFVISYLPGNAKLDFALEGVQLTDLRSLYEESLPVIVEQGVVNVTTEGGLKEGLFDSKVALDIQKLKIAEKPGSDGILGLDKETSGYAVQGINAFGESSPIKVNVGIVGPPDDPSVEGKVPFLEIAKKGLTKLGRKELDKYISKIDGEVNAVTDTAKKEAGKAVEAGKKAGAEVLEGALKGDVKGSTEKAKDLLKGDKPDGAETKKKIEDAKGALEGLFKKKKD